MEMSEIEKQEANDITHSRVGEISEADQRLCGNVVICIEKMLEQLPQVNAKCSIYRISKELCEVNRKAYTPQLISIGPIHCGTHKDLIANEPYKLQGFINFLRRINNNKIESMEDLLKTGAVNILVEKAHHWVKKARNCYATPTNMMDIDEFVMMMLVDACFVVEFLILKFDCDHPDCKFFQIQDNVDISFYQGIDLHILYDLIKLENQVPFFLLRNLFNLIPKHDVPMIIFSFGDLTHKALKFRLVRKYEIDLYKEPKHLVDLLSFYFVPLPLDDMQNKHHGFKNGEEHRWIPPSITELCEAGVTIKKAENAKYVTNITFKNGVLEIPPLHIYDEFELMLRNMVAFEQISAGKKNKYVIQYVLFMDDLISTEKDVRLLVEAGVIINQIGGSDKEVSDLFNNLCKFITAPRSSHFDPIIKDLCDHCNGRWNKAKASLKHNYFNTPWAFISLFAASLLILLTILQTIFSAISAFPSA
ncbi:UPF0481 protein At3g47200-like [Benincasa hispida]|uniref:UPF0481 protein At3g47200-like n=1 Tax=Benincasa hispida TaxID=102211 RepID=UPI001902027B|nr:UPF0481 protein At3g47200-like [Benincasa hispida]